LKLCIFKVGCEENYRRMCNIFQHFHAKVYEWTTTRKKRHQFLGYKLSKHESYETWSEGKEEWL